MQNGWLRLFQTRERLDPGVQNQQRSSVQIQKRYSLRNEQNAQCGVLRSMQRSHLVLCSGTKLSSTVFVLWMNRFVRKNNFLLTFSFPCPHLSSLPSSTPMSVETSAKLLSDKLLSNTQKQQQPKPTKKPQELFQGLGGAHCTRLEILRATNCMNSHTDFRIGSQIHTILNCGPKSGTKWECAAEHITGPVKAPQSSTNPGTNFVPFKPILNQTLQKPSLYKHSFPKEPASRFVWRL